MSDVRNPTTGWLLALTVLLLCLLALHEPEESRAAELVGLHGVVWSPARVEPASGARVRLSPVDSTTKSYQLVADGKGRFGVSDPLVSGAYRVEVEWRNSIGTTLRLTQLATFESEMHEPLHFVLAD